MNPFRGHVVIFQVCTDNDSTSTGSLLVQQMLHLHDNLKNMESRRNRPIREHARARLLLKCSFLQA